MEFSQEQQNKITAALVLKGWKARKHNNTFRVWINKITWLQITINYEINAVYYAATKDIIIYFSHGMRFFDSVEDLMHFIDKLQKLFKRY